MKLFDKWDTNIEIKDPGLKNSINLRPLLVPRTGGRTVKTRFHNSQINIVERLINRLMVVGHKGKKHKNSSGRNTGKAFMIYRMVRDAFVKIEEKTKKNPIEVLVKALENAAPREEITTIEYGGARYPKAVDCSPQRRVDIALKNLSQGVYAKCFNKKVSAVNALVNEIMDAYNINSNSNAISKKFELERQADSSR